MGGSRHSWDRRAAPLGAALLAACACATPSVRVVGRGACGEAEPDGAVLFCDERGRLVTCAGGTPLPAAEGISACVTLEGAPFLVTCEASDGPGLAELVPCPACQVANERPTFVTLSEQTCVLQEGAGAATGVPGATGEQGPTDERGPTGERGPTDEPDALDDERGPTDEDLEDLEGLEGPGAEEPGAAPEGASDEALDAGPEAEEPGAGDEDFSFEPGDLEALLEEELEEEPAPLEDPSLEKPPPGEDDEIPRDEKPPAAEE